MGIYCNLKTVNKLSWGCVFCPNRFFFGGQIVSAGYAEGFPCWRAHGFPIKFSQSGVTYCPPCPSPVYWELACLLCAAYYYDIGKLDSSSSFSSATFLWRFPTALSVRRILRRTELEDTSSVIYTLAAKLRQFQQIFNFYLLWWSVPK